ncbi:MarR family winged helix-turn-helix transcriptional regulator [Serratia sp. M24T3]|uniref:MarR family winged helix-turn-helix transcriptional regulator n=1 Tax=Rouxiella sp. WC2420 TaxID=3234145 RepID=A0AB39VKB7_9GAMM|nr:MarR family winged helix-turn-helix transcriptional regulator [Serratia sp. M24T3]EIC86062.1 transcriptional regulator protein [Serratia sp. M24T3]
MSHKMTDDWQTALIWMVLPAGRAWQRTAGEALEQSGLPLSASAALLIIARLGNGIRQKDVAEEAAIDPAAIARSVIQLENQGLLLRKADSTDARAKTLHLTQEGQAVASTLEKTLESVRKKILAGISDQDGKTAVRVLSHLESASRKA